MRGQARAVVFVIGALALILLSAACTRTDVPLVIGELRGASESEGGLSGEASPTESARVMGTNATYAVVWLSEDNPLTVHYPAGIAGTVVDTFQQDEISIHLSNGWTMLGTSEWVEIFLPDGNTGWVNAWNLTEEVSSVEFCQDERALELLNDFRDSVNSNDGVVLESLVSPKRGLSIRRDWGTTEVIIPINDISRLFEDPRHYSWGLQTGSDFVVEGSFQHIVLPDLQDVFLLPAELNCNELTIGLTNKEANWPSEYENLNFFSVHRPAPTPGNGFNWNTWAVGIEYINGIPYIAVLVQYLPEL